MVPRWLRRLNGHAPTEAFVERRNDDNICWWCGAPATTAEHKFKQTDLRRMKGDDDFLYHYSEDDDGRLGRINGTNAKRVKFRKNLCGPCNNSRSQPFDHAYTTFSEWSNDNMASIYKIDMLDMGDIFSGKDVTAETYNLARYFMKYLGCRIDDSGFQVPNEIVKFCDGETYMPHVEIVFFRDKALNLYNEISRAASIDAFPLTHSAISAWLSPENNLPINLYGESVIGNLGVMYGWNSQLKVKADPFYRYRRTTLHERKDLPLPEHYERWPDYLKEYRQFI